MYHGGRGQAQVGQETGDGRREAGPDLEDRATDMLSTWSTVPYLTLMSSIWV